ncbi:MAG TPA: class I mannose-6-phosphate isomerase [Bryobacteraceae bacterium]|nr:class I mannose-6-phosphate isomerase [Bryobacteraceae bacterium]
MALRKLAPQILDKDWGATTTSPWLENEEGRKIGEIWFADRSVLPVLVKFLFTSDRLSVQVHPDDVYAQAHGEERGKTEMWHILQAKPGAMVAIGLRETTSGERVREAALDGGIVEMMEWLPARPGDTFFIPARTIHAIGAGLVLCEIQQYSDTTYRLYDYQRTPLRPLHLDDALAVSNFGPCDGRREGDIVKCDYFRSERVGIEGRLTLPTPAGPTFYIATAGEGSIDGQPFHGGEVWLAEAGTPPVIIESPAAAFVLASLPYSSE